MRLSQTFAEPERKAACKIGALFIPRSSSPTDYLAMLKTFALIFITMFLAEIGDKSQLATLLYASDAQVSRWVVFAASASALVCAVGIGVLVGSQLERFVQPQTLKWISGVGFLLVGAWTLLAK
jgi:putative Ca2+/H+ antiporter (TMEM165/GDT1 family)